eukprot:NODE_359_length_10180_cov_0.431703.p7 type:complete len:157 gc:universal NODE_359_length_10180_cov_0.431703:5559-6029(+)
MFRVLSWWTFLNKKPHYSSLMKKLKNNVVNPLTGENIEIADELREEQSKGESVHAASADNQLYQKLEHAVLRWLNSIFNSQGIIVRNIGEECNDGILLGRVLNKVFKTPYNPAAVLTDGNRRQNIEDLFVVLRDVHGIQECDDYNQECILCLYSII